MKKYLTAIYLRLSKEDDKNSEFRSSAQISRAMENDTGMDEKEESNSKEPGANA